MQVRPRGESRGAHVPDELPLGHACPFPDPFCKARQVAVEGLVAVGVADDDELAVPALPAGRKDLAARHGRDGRPLRRHVVRAVVGPADLEDRVESRLREARADPAETQRRLEEGLAQRAALGVVVVGLAVDLEAVGPVRHAVVDELGGQDGPVLAELAVAVEPLDEKAERVAPAQGRGEIDVPGEDVGEVEREQQVLRAAAHGGDQVVLDGALEAEHLPLVLEVEPLGLVAFAGPGDADQRIVADPVDEGVQAFFRVHVEFVGPAGPELPGAVDARHGLLHGEELPRVDVVALEDLVERLPPLDHAADAQQAAHLRFFGGSCGIRFGGGAEEEKGRKQRNRCDGEDGRAESFLCRCHPLETPLPRFGAAGACAGHEKGASRRSVLAASWKPRHAEPGWRLPFAVP
ncbi:MAG: hypothetical protein A4E67_01176 [Syntrophaceae bacterium PtaB.Bin038]|nr:MAG: hypothetical protein A4E67_01176 [Syntrophaceae bacterium PtaB.Bin038]